ncbi:hypothetical protein [Anthocerotibacter panamensis]|uniref:hypothetical protein n=1 Tax=Anthocerotibacter panamensis TaxID=2857077 RepID=UPI001C4046B6|nr:hypothetical protein [Anthocerotibacter panamensis]
MTQKIAYRGGLVTFRLPENWVAEYEEEGGGIFYDESDDLGILRLNVLTFKNYGAEEVSSKTIETMLNASSQAKGTPKPLPNGNILVAYEETEIGDGEEILIYYWEVGNPVPPAHVRLAIFSYTILASESESPRAKEVLAFLDREIAASVFTPTLGEKVEN